MTVLSPMDKRSPMKGSSLALSCLADQAGFWGQSKKELCSTSSGAQKSTDKGARGS